MAQSDPDSLEQRAREALTGTVPQLIAAARLESDPQVIKDADEEYKQSYIEDGHGVWPDEPGNSVWTPRGSYLAAEYGLKPGQSIRWHEGAPDLREYEVCFSDVPDRKPPNLISFVAVGSVHA